MRTKQYTYNNILKQDALVDNVSWMFLYGVEG